ncbi:hypothetical protein [Paenibacillus harenae]|nr:hypothetical protein [Paenibacillus harenae]MDQ0059087.1 hypothetical protein [Paenibacillus harenae]
MFGDDAETFLALVDFQSANLEEIEPYSSEAPYGMLVRRSGRVFQGTTE